ncbi:hypothetical protein [Porphyrobacter sp. YT40]|uniref:hypothetical protein n=1 Tax=Porphyrobacter sp. YT40 TaxID=2547601 RepID=UPI0011442EFC|nr:hypothetical protein [Porphyrobacter sp. YT40]QDH33773.1 hypothetical protein E2E27_05150 [Porphyrobacter sp. YT40]
MGFEFPACQDCQHRYRQEEQYFAFICRMCDRDNANYDRDTSRRLISGVANNLKHLLPNPHLSAIEKRRGLKSLGLSKPLGMASSDIPVVELPPEIDPVLRAVAIKIGLALFYRHKGSVAKSHYGVAAYWSQFSDQTAMQKLSRIAKELSGAEIGRRPNLEFGNRFQYRWSKEAEGEPDIFVCLARFGLGLTICVMIADITNWASDEFDEEWVTLGRWASEKFFEVF